MSQWQQAGQPYGQVGPTSYVAGWYPDPGGAGERWWDGSQWTTGVRPVGFAAPPAVAVTNGTNPFAIVSLVLSLVWIFWLGSILAVVFGHIALSQIGRRQQGGRGLAVAGLVIGYVGVGFLVLFIVLAIVGGHSSSQVYYGNPN